jgi:choline-sulfatase
LTGDNSKWDNESISQFGGTNMMIKQDHLKYQYYGADMPEVLFDLDHNPEETVNFIDHPDYAEPVEHFRIRRKELGFTK